MTPITEEVCELVHRMLETAYQGDATSIDERAEELGLTKEQFLAGGIAKALTDNSVVTRIEDLN